VTVTPKLPVEDRPEMVRFDVINPPAGTMTQSGLNDGRGPYGTTTTVRQTLPEKLLRLVTDTTVEFEEPTKAVISFGLATMPKSTTLTVKTVEWEAEPPLPVTFTV